MPPQTWYSVHGKKGTSWAHTRTLIPFVTYLGLPADSLLQASSTPIDEPIFKLKSQPHYSNPINIDGTIPPSTHSRIRKSCSK